MSAVSRGYEFLSHEELVSLLYKKDRIIQAREELLNVEKDSIEMLKKKLANAIDERRILEEQLSRHRTKVEEASALFQTSQGNGTRVENAIPSSLSSRPRNPQENQSSESSLTASSATLPSDGVFSAAGLPPEATGLHFLQTNLSQQEKAFAAIDATTKQKDSYIGEVLENTGVQTMDQVEKLQMQLEEMEHRKLEQEVQALEKRVQSLRENNSVHVEKEFAATELSFTDSARIAESQQAGFQVLPKMETQAVVPVAFQDANNNPKSQQADFQALAQKEFRETEQVGVGNARTFADTVIDHMAKFSASDTSNAQILPDMVGDHMIKSSGLSPGLPSILSPLQVRFNPQECACDEDDPLEKTLPPTTRLDPPSYHNPPSCEDPRTTSSGPSLGSMGNSCEHHPPSRNSIRVPSAITGTLPKSPFSGNLFTTYTFIG